MYEVWYAIPSANPELCRRHLPAWRERGYRVAVLQNRERGEVPADVVVWRDEYPGWAGSVNELCKDHVPSSADIVVTGGDDMLPHPGVDAEELARGFFERFPDGFGVMQPVGDTFMNASEYCGSPWLGRGWIEHAYGGGGPMHGGYRHNWADHELRWVAELHDALWLRADLRQSHEHFSRNGEEAPEYWNDAVGAHDRADVERFIGRFFLGFPGSEARGRCLEKSELERRYPGTAHRHWVSRYGGDWLTSDLDRRLGETLRACADAGCRRVAIYGAGTATRAASASLQSPPVGVAYLIDDHPSLRGEYLWGYPIVPLERAHPAGIDAVIVHVREGAERLAERVRESFPAAVRIVVSGGSVDVVPSETNGLAHA